MRERTSRRPRPERLSVSLPTTTAQWQAATQGLDAPAQLPTTTAEWQSALRRMGLLGKRGVPMNLPTTTAEWQVFIRAVS